MSTGQDPTAEPFSITDRCLAAALVGRRIADVVEDDLGEQYILFEDGARLKVFGEEAGDVLGKLTLPGKAKEPPSNKAENGSS